MWCKCGAGRSQTCHERPISTPSSATTWAFSGADDGIRTRDPHLGKVMLYQLSHVRLLPPDSSNGGGSDPCRRWSRPVSPVSHRRLGELGECVAQMIAEALDFGNELSAPEDPDVQRALVAR